jgi:hypothetical protein
VIDELKICLDNNHLSCGSNQDFLREGISYLEELHEFKVKKLVELEKFICDGMHTDGGHHKQWYLGQVLLMLGFTKEEVEKWLKYKDYDIDWGIAP